jgi:uncharacterized membrane protein HdeD (DUF308 family)
MGSPEEEAMNRDSGTLDVRALTTHWWALVVRGIAAILFGVLAFLAPGLSLLVLIIAFGAYALVDGLFSLVVAGRVGAHGRSFGWLLFAGIIGIAAGIVTFAWPRITALALLAVIAFWALFTGAAEIAAAVRIRRHVHGEWMLATGGVLSIAFGVLLLMFPSAGALAMVWMIGGYAILFGVLLVGLGVRLHHWEPPVAGRTF